MGRNAARGIRDPARQLPLAHVKGSGLAFFFFDDTLAWLPRVKELYPCGTERRVTSRGGAFFFVVYTMTPLQVERCAPTSAPPRSAS